MKQPDGIGRIVIIHPTKNIGLDTLKLSTFSHKKVWWLCDKGHEWEQAVSARAKNPNSCPICSGRRILEGFNDLSTIKPNIAKEWHPFKNGLLTPKEVTVGSNKKVWWQCEEGHEWEAVVETRAIRGYTCPYCSGRHAISGVNDLLTINPELAQEWHPTKNGMLTPQDVLAGSAKKVWWLGTCGHEWESIIANRSAKDASCPYCSGHKKLAGFNDLSTTHPEIASQWNFNRNKKMLPSMFSKGSDVKVWWQCEKDHEWEANISVRTSQNTGCPVCSNRQIITNHNGLDAVTPDIAAEWHPTKNGDLLSSDVSPSSNKKVWWQCEKGHEWEAYIYSRTNAGCRKCTASLKNSKGEAEVKHFLETLGFNVSQSNYDLIDGYEIDLYIPEKNIAIEFNGLFWHTEDKGKDSKYHYNKWLLCQQKKIQLIHIWEDDWSKRKDIVQKSLIYKLGVYKGEKIYARKTEIVPMSKKQAETFFTNNHIQGYSSGSIYLGLKKDNEIESAIIVKKENNGKTFNIIRYASKTPIIGGFTKLISYIIKQYNFEEFITFSDHGISDGNLYSSNGFTADKELAPDYMYLVNGERKHKFGYRIQKFKTNDKLKWQEGMSETQLAKLNNLERIWDAGKTRWVKKIEPK